jgi:hypothetical protein
MKKLLNNTAQQVRSKTNFDIFYTYSEWGLREIEGVSFVPVVKQKPPHQNLRPNDISWMRKDSLEFIK